MSGCGTSIARSCSRGNLKMWGITLVLLKLLGIDFVPIIANALSTDVAAINLLLSIFMCYPLALIYHKYIRKRTYDDELKHIYFIAMGLDIAYFNFGSTFYHNIVPVLVMFITNKYVKPGRNHCLITFFFNMGYLVAGYIYTESENYDITWTMPQCVITLKLIALSFDLSDGLDYLAGKELSPNRKETALATIPTLMEIFGYVYFPACFLVGPIFSFKRYNHFVTGVYPLDDKNAEKRRIIEFWKTLASGLICLAFYQVVGAYFNMEFMLSEGFLEYSLFYRHIYCGIWSYGALSKYISCWLLTEGACILFGLSYNESVKDQPRWDACRNVNLRRFITSTKFQHYIDSFNCNTNYFAAEYIYKRLKFMGNKNTSQIITLFFLALWHGVNSGYYVTFYNEFMLILFEKQFEDIFKKTKLYDVAWSKPYLKYVWFAILKLYTLIYMGWSLTPFDLKLGHKWIYVYSTMWFSGYILFLPWTFCHKPLLIRLIKKYNLFKE